MSRLHQDNSGISFDRFDTDDGAMFVVDLGPGTDASVDIVDGTAVIVIEGDTESVQREIELPEGDAQAFIRNGVLTFEVSQ